MRDPIITITFSRRRIIKLYPNDATAQRYMTSLLADWCGSDPRLSYRTSPRCGCKAAPGMWAFEADMLSTYGPVPFTSFGKPIRWRWWHTLTGDPSFTVTLADLPEQVPER